MRFPSRATALSAVLSAFLCAASAQQPAPTPTTVSAAPLLLDIVVTDKSGKPVTGLQPSDFTVLDNKQPTKILSFRPHDATQLPPSQIDAATELIFIIDECNTPYARIIYARQGLENYLRENNGELTHPVAVGYFTYSGLDMQEKPTVDGLALASALEKGGQEYRAVEDDHGGPVSYDHFQRSIEGLINLVALLQNKPGRKAVVWLSPGWPMLNGIRENDITPKEQKRILESVATLNASLRQARVTLYSVDPLGPAGTGEHSVFYQNFTDGLSNPDKAQYGDEALQVFVTQTGGRAIFGNDPIANSINHEVSDLTAFYTITIPPATADKPNQYHDLKILVDRPDLKVRTRTGYYAQPTP